KDAREAPRILRPSQKCCSSTAVILFPSERAGEENEQELPDLDLVTVGQDRGVNQYPVHISAVETADVDHHEVIAFAPELGVPTRNSDIVEEDVTVRVAASAGGFPVEQEARARVRAAFDHQQGRTRWQRIDPGRSRLRGRTLSAVRLREEGPEDRGGLR